MAGWAPFVATNASLIFCLGGILWYKFHRLRVDVEAQFAAMTTEWRKLRESQPPILVGEFFLAERFDTLERELRDVRVRLEEMEKTLGNGGQRGASV